ncbi:hypothetical protein [Pseudoxanthomonas japonensis]|jgi:hypothetical protein|uniref:hypothetical protein n=1 Tax=Pseudoxanthomonas japonensis TaxID=69284 RepID=UPI001BD10923|nr:hypothetical protein [Pseudoxanthomonas japonensis]MCR6625496.1 hypothetical protein [Pseudoxanthomonas sp.]
MPLLIATLFAFAGQAGAHDPYYLDRTINSANDLVGWCRAEAEARYAARRMPTYQWTSSQVDRGNTLFVEGKLRADGQDVVVRCSVTRGAQLRYASIQIDDPRVR